MFYAVTGRQFLGSGIHLEERAALHCISRLLERFERGDT